MTATQSIGVANAFINTNDIDASLAFYRDVLGFSVHTDVTHEGFRWASVSTPRQPDLEIVLDQVGSGAMPMTDDDHAALVDLLAKGLLTPMIFDCDDVDAVFECVRAAGADVLQEPADQFYGVRDCAFRDPAGNMLRFKSDLPQG